VAATEDEAMASTVAVEVHTEEMITTVVDEEDEVVHEVVLLLVLAVRKNHKHPSRSDLSFLTFE
jgi:hypothetical protein